MSGGPRLPFAWSPARDNWSREACRRLFPTVAREYWGECEVEFVPPHDRVDTQYGTDCYVRGVAAHGSVALRLRSHSHYRRFGDVTFRYDSLQTPGRLLEVASATAGAYWCGFADTDYPTPPTEIVEWHLIRLQDALEALRGGRLRFRGPFPNADESSRLIAATVSSLRSLGLIIASKAPQTAVVHEAPKLTSGVQLALPLSPGGRYDP